jgi:hypothetical protein
MKKTIKLTESDLTRIVKRVIQEQTKDTCFDGYKFSQVFQSNIHVPQSNIKNLGGGQNYSKTDSKGNDVILFKGTDWTKGGGVIIPRNIESPGVKVRLISWMCSSGKLNIFDNNIK